MSEGPRTRTGGLMGAAGLISFLAVVGLASWSVLVPIDGAVIVSGAIEVPGRPRPVQAPDGGVIEAIAVREGERVRRGQIVARLDGRLLRAERAVLEARLSATDARLSRLRAELTGEDMAPAEDEAATGEAAVLAARRASLEGRKARLEERLTGLAARAEGLSGAVAALQEQIGHLSDRRADAASLAERGLAPRNAVADLDNQLAELRGRLAGLEAQEIEVAGLIAETRLEVAQQDGAVREEAATALHAAEVERREILLEIARLDARLARSEIRAPAAGVIHDLQVSAAGAVLAPGATLASVVPQDGPPAIAMRLDPSRVDEVEPGQPARLLFSAYAAGEDPELPGHVLSVSPDVIVDPATGRPHYRLLLGVAPEASARFAALDPVPGMPVEAFLSTGGRTLLSYLTRPLTDQLSRAFREG